MKYPLSARILWVATFLCWGVGYAAICLRQSSTLVLFGSLLAGGLCMIAAELIAATEEEL